MPRTLISPSSGNRRVVIILNSVVFPAPSGPIKPNISDSFTENISFSVNESEIFGFIGPDGAGKTTLFRIITTLLLPDEGEMSVLGMDSTTDYKELRKNIGYMPGRFSLYQDLSVEENLNFFATVFGTTAVSY